MATPTFIHPGPVFVQSNATANRYITSGELSAEAGLGTVTSLKSGSNITFQPSTITVTGSIGLNPNLVLDSLTVSGAGLFYGTVTANAGIIRPYQILDTVVDLAGLGNSFTVSGAIPVGLCLGTLIHVQQTIVGCSGINAGSVETPTLWAALAHSTLASGTKTTDANILATSITRYTSTDNVVLQASGGVFTTGKVNIRTCYVALS